MYKEVKDIANNLKILTWSDDPTECLSIKIDLYKGKFGNITVAFDFQANDYVLRQNITEENYCNIYRNNSCIIDSQYNTAAYHK